jgi:hypothetical protein
MEELTLPIPDFHMLQLFFNLRMDTGHKKFQFQDLLQKLRNQNLKQVKLEMMAKKQLLMLKIPRNSLMEELKQPIPDFHTPPMENIIDKK